MKNSRWPSIGINPVMVMFNFFKKNYLCTLSSFLPFLRSCLIGSLLPDVLWSNLRYQGMISAIIQGESELSYLRAEAQRINADVREIIPHGMDSNPIVDERLESVIADLSHKIVRISYVGYVNILLTYYIHVLQMWLHSRANTILMVICSQVIELL